MPDIGSISAAIATVKTSMDIAKAIKDSKTSLSEAETKLKIADLVITLADVKFELADVQDLLRKKDDEIRVLKEKVDEKDSLTFDGKLYWKEEDKIPFCTVCFEKEKKLYHLTYYKRNDWTSEHYRCKICDNTYYL